MKERKLAFESMNMEIGRKADAKLQLAVIPHASPIPFDNKAKGLVCLRVTLNVMKCQITLYNSRVSGTWRREQLVGTSSPNTASTRFDLYDIPCERSHEVAGLKHSAKEKSRTSPSGFDSCHL